MVQWPADGQVVIDGQTEDRHQCGEVRSYNQTLADTPTAAENAGHCRVVEESTDATQQIGNGQARQKANVGCHGASTDHDRE